MTKAERAVLLEMVQGWELSIDRARTMIQMKHSRAVNQGRHVAYIRCAYEMRAFLKPKPKS